MNILINLLLAIWLLVALLMMLVILMQRPKSEGLGAAFGGAVTENIFGAQTTNVLVKFTAWLAGIFFVLTFALSILYAHRSMGGNTALRRELLKQQTGGQPSPASSAVQASPVPTTMPTSPAPGITPAAPGSVPLSPSPVASPAPDSGAGVLPAGNATPSTTASPPAAATPPPAAKPSATP